MKLHLYNHWASRYPLNIGLFKFYHVQTCDLPNCLVVELFNFCLSVTYGKPNEGWVERYNREHAQ